MAALETSAETIAACFGIMVDAVPSMHTRVVRVTEVNAVKVNALLPVQGHPKRSAILVECHVSNATNEVARSFQGIRAET